MPVMIIIGYGDSTAANTGLYTAVLLAGCQVPRKAVSKVTDTRRYLILVKRQQER